MADGSGSSGDIDPEYLALLRDEQKLARLMVALSEQELAALKEMRATLGSGTPITVDEMTRLFSILDRAPAAAVQEVTAEEAVAHLRSLEQSANERIESIILLPASQRKTAIKKAVSELAEIQLAGFPHLQAARNLPSIRREAEERLTRIITAQVKE